MPLTLPIQIGKKYVRRDGTVVEAYPHHLESCAIVSGQQSRGAACWRNTGRILPESEVHPCDIVSDYVEPGKAHPHAALMALYAQDAAETDKPWERWQARRRPGEFDPDPLWRDLDGQMQWTHGQEYRRKPKTIRIGEFDVPEPLRVAPKRGAKFYTPNIDPWKMASTHHEWTWTDHPADHARLQAGLAHLSSEAADQTARALMALTSSA